MQNSPLRSTAARQHELPADLVPPKSEHLHVVVALGTGALLVSIAVSLALFWLIALPSP